jgi:nicotinate-nucleotide adenylyltransferase
MTQTALPRGAGLLGVFGGTFNPIHLGHLRAAEQVAEQLALGRVLFVPSGTPPHKRDEPLAPAGLRLAWVRRAVAGNKRFEVDPLEVERGGPSFSIDTLRAIAARVAPQKPVFVIGCDALADLASWREPGAVLECAHLAVMARRAEGGAAARGGLAEHFPAALRDAIELEPGGLSAHHRRADTWIRWLEIEALPISATDVRARLRAGRSIRYLVPDAVHDEIVASGAYPADGTDA